MALDVYTQLDILNILRALNVANDDTTALATTLLHAVEAQARQPVADLREHPEALLVYQRGYRTALLAVALAIGINIKSKETKKDLETGVLF